MKGLLSRLLAVTFAGSLALQTSVPGLQDLNLGEAFSDAFAQGIKVSENLTNTPRILKEVTPPEGATTEEVSTAEALLTQLNIEEADASRVIRLTADIALTDEDVAAFGPNYFMIKAGTKYIDLNGHTLDLTGRTGSQAVPDVATVYLYSSAGKGKVANTDDRVFEINGGKVAVDNVDFENNAIALQQNGNSSLSVENCTFTENGRAIEVNGNSGLAVANGVFTENGKAIGVYGTSEATITGSTFTGNGNDSDGGAIEAVSDIDISNSTFSGNTAPSGGAIKLANDGTDCVLTNCTFENNFVTYGGGAIYAVGGGEVSITINGADTSFKGNSAAYCGGAIWAAGTTITVNAGTFEGNKVVNEVYDSNGSGGAMRLQGNTLLTINDGTFKSNTTNTGGGGAIKAGHYGDDNVRVIIHGGEFANNASMGEGGAISIGANCHGLIQATEGNIIDIHDNHMVGDQDWGGGGVFVADGGTLQLYDAAIYENKAGGYGGGLAGCSTARIFINENGAAIFDNTAEQYTRADDTTGLNPAEEAEFPHMSNPDNVKSEDWIYTQNDKVFHENKDYQDYFCALAGEVHDSMLGGGYEQWRGSADSHHVTTRDADAGTDGYKGKGSNITAAHVTGLTSYASDGDKSAATNAAKVIIHDNGAYTHGGGVLANGVLVFGDIQEDYTLPNRLMISLTKKVADAEAHESFLYNIYQQNGNDIEKLTNIAPVWSFTDRVEGEGFDPTVGTAYAVLDLAYEDFETLPAITYTEEFADRSVSDKVEDETCPHAELTYYVAENLDHLSDRYEMDETVYQVKVAVWRVEKTFTFTLADGTVENESVHTLDIEVYEVNKGEFLKDADGNITGFDSQEKRNPGAFWFYGSPQTPRAFFLWGRYAGASIGPESEDTSYDYFWLNETENHASELALHQMKVIGGGGIRRADEFDPSYTNRQYLWPEAMLEVTKDLEGRELGEGEFTFKITHAGYKGPEDEDYDPDYKNPMPIGLGLLNELSSDEINEQTITFTPVKHETAVDDMVENSTFRFTPQGNAPVPEGETAGQPFDVVEATDAENPTTFDIRYYLAAEANEASFEYIMEEVKDEGDKDDPALDGKQYDENQYRVTVKIYRIDERNITTDVLFEQIPKDYEEITNDDTGYAKTWNMIFRELGSYRYLIEEIEHEDQGITFDQNKYYAVVEVTEDEDGYLNAEVKYQRIDGESTTDVDGVTFYNTYKAKDGEIVLHVTKELSGREWIDGDEFTFVLAADENNPEGSELPEETTATVNSETENHTADFGAIKFTEEGEYTFTITESAGPQGGIAYDTEPRTVTVTVTDDLKGHLVPVADPENATVNVTNTYDAAGTVNLQVAKKVVNSTWPEGESVTFTLTGADGAPMPSTGNTATLYREGTAVFGTINYTLADAGKTYTYTISETEDFGSNWSKSGDVTVNVTVTDNGNGTLKAEAVYGPQGNVITNTYAAEGLGEILVEKVLNGRDWTDSDTFTFTLSAEDGTPMPEVTEITITKDSYEHSNSFGLIHYTAAGTYTYTVKETKGNEKGIVYDEAEHIVTINAVDDGNGNIVPAEGTEMVQFVTITNTYIDVKVEKVDDSNKAVKGAVLAVKDSNGQIVDQWTTDGTVHEVKGLLPGLKYVLTEVKAPEGYEKASDINFATDPDGLVQTLKMVDKAATVPDTGDSNHTAEWIAMMGMSVLLAGFAFAFRKRFN